MPDAQGDINTTAVFGGTCDIRATVRAAARIYADHGTAAAAATRACVTRVAIPSESNTTEDLHFDRRKS
jgi:hypothetical protein